MLSKICIYILNTNLHNIVGMSSQNTKYIFKILVFEMFYPSLGEELFQTHLILVNDLSSKLGGKDSSRFQKVSSRQN